MKDPAHEPLDDELSKLGLDVEPAQDLWPTIARNLRHDADLDHDANLRTGRAPANGGGGPFIGRPFSAPRSSVPRFTAPRLMAAAALACACTASALTWAVLHSRSVGVTAPTALTANQVHAVSFDDPRDRAYEAARADMVHTFRERLALLDPVTRAKIESSLAIIRQAHADIRKALSATPDSPVLEQLLASTLHDEFDLYDQVVRTTQPALTRT